MPKPDQWHLALAQQNGITAIILALTLAIQFDSAVAIIAVNLVHAAANWAYDKRQHQPAARAVAVPAQASGSATLGESGGQETEKTLSKPDTRLWTQARMTA